MTTAPPRRCCWPTCADRENASAGLFDPNRFTPRAFRRLASSRECGGRGCASSPQGLRKPGSAVDRGPLARRGRHRHHKGQKVAAARDERGDAESRCRRVARTSAVRSTGTDAERAGLPLPRIALRPYRRGARGPRGPPARAQAAGLSQHARVRTTHARTELRARAPRPDHHELLLIDARLKAIIALEPFGSLREQRSQRANSRGRDVRSQASRCQLVERRWVSHTCDCTTSNVPPGARYRDAWVQMRFSSMRPSRPASHALARPRVGIASVGWDIRRVLTIRSSCSPPSGSRGLRRERSETPLSRR